MPVPPLRMTHVTTPVTARARFCAFASCVRYIVAAGAAAGVVELHAQFSPDSSSMPSMSSNDYPRIQRVPIFFPPNPPPLGRALLRGGQPPGRFAAPEELA